MTVYHKRKRHASTPFIPVDKSVEKLQIKLHIATSESRPYIDVWAEWIKRSLFRA